MLIRSDVEYITFRDGNKCASVSLVHFMVVMFTNLYLRSNMVLQFRPFLFLYLLKECGLCRGISIEL